MDSSGNPGQSQHLGSLRDASSTCRKTWAEASGLGRRNLGRGRCQPEVMTNLPKTAGRAAQRERREGRTDGGHELTGTSMLRLWCLHLQNSEVTAGLEAGDGAEIRRSLGDSKQEMGLKFGEHWGTRSRRRDCDWVVFPRPDAEP